MELRLRPSNVDGAFIHPQRRLMQDFRQRRMGMNDARDIFAGGRKFHRHNRFGDHFGDVGADHVDCRGCGLYPRPPAL